MRVSRPTLNRLKLGALTSCSGSGDYWHNTGLLSAACPSWTRDAIERHAMRIQLTLRGGSYGTLRLQPIEIDDMGAPLSEELLDVIHSSAFGVYRIRGGLHASREAEAVDPLQTGLEIYEFTISTGAESTEKYSIPHSTIERDEGLRKLVESIWSLAKPL